MIKRVNLWKRSIFARLILTFLVAMIPIYSIGFIIYDRGLEQIKAETLNTRLAQIAYYMNDLDSNIQRLKILQSDSIYSTELNVLANNQEFLNYYEKGNNSIKIQQRLNALMSSSIYVENVVALIPSIGRTIPAWGSITDLRQEDLDTVKIFDNSTFSQIVYLNNNLYMNIVFPPGSPQSIRDPLYAIQIKLSSAELKKAISQFNIHPGSGTFLFNSEKEFIAASNVDDTVFSQVRAEVQERLGVSKDGNVSVYAGGKRYLAMYRTSSYLGLTLCNYIPEEEIFSFLKRYQVRFLLFSIAAAAIVAIFIFSFYRYIQQPMKRLIQAFKRLEGGDMKFSIKHGYDDEFEYLYERFNTMLANLNTTIDQAYRQKLMFQRAELKQLQSQINPHFLYNSFFMLYTMTRRCEYDNLERFALQLGEYFQFITRSAADEVTLSKEVEHARTYCEIQALRFSNRIRVVFGELPPELADFIVPRLIIQPVMENAFEHGLERKEESGLLQIIFEVVSGGFLIHIEDNGESMTDRDIEELQEKIHAEGDNIETTGIVNIHRRIQLKFGMSSGINVSRGNSGGLKVTIIIGFLEDM